MGRTSHDTDLNMAYGVVYNGLEGTGENGVDFHLGRLDRVGPYAGYWFISLDLPHEFPQVFIDADAKGSLLNESNFRLRIKDGYRYELEGSFADYFTLYAAQSTAVRVATYILTPDVMQQVLSVAPHVDIEFHRDKLYILWLPQQRTPRETLIDGFGILNSVGEPLFERAAKYLHMEETVSAELLNADISFNAFTEAAQNIGKVGGRDIRKAASIALSKRSFARVAIFVGALAFGFGVFVLYLYVRYFSPIAWH